MDICFLPLTAWDCSAWVRAYALFLEERLQCFKVLKYDIEAERLPKLSPGEERVPNFAFYLVLWPLRSSFSLSLMGFDFGT